MLGTKEQLKLHLGISSTTYDDVLTQILTQVDKFIKTDLKREIEAYEYIDDIYDGDIKFIKLKDFPLSEDDFTFEYNKGDSETPDWETVPRTDYELYFEQGIICMNSIYYGKRIFRINYTAGDDTIPEDLEMLVIRLSSKIYNKRKSEGTSNESLENVSFGWQSLLSVEDKMTMDNYRLKYFI